MGKGKTNKTAIRVPSSETWSRSHLNEANSRPLFSCGPIVSSADRDRVYFVESSAYPMAHDPAVRQLETISASATSMIWMYEHSTDTIALIARNLTSIQAMLLEQGPKKKEVSLLCSESTLVSCSSVDIMLEFDGQE